MQATGTLGPQLPAMLRALHVSTTRSWGETPRWWRQSCACMHAHVDEADAAKPAIHWKQKAPVQQMIYSASDWARRRSNSAGGREAQASLCTRIVTMHRAAVRSCALSACDRRRTTCPACSWL